MLVAPPLSAAAAVNIAGRVIRFHSTKTSTDEFPLLTFAETIVGSVISCIRLLRL